MFSHCRIRLVKHLWFLDILGEGNQNQGLLRQLWICKLYLKGSWKQIRNMHAHWSHSVTYPIMFAFCMGIVLQLKCQVFTLFLSQFTVDPIHGSKPWRTISLEYPGPGDPRWLDCLSGFPSSSCAVYGISIAVINVMSLINQIAGQWAVLQCYFWGSKKK